MNAKNSYLLNADYNPCKTNPSTMMTKNGINFVSNNINL